MTDPQLPPPVGIPPVPPAPGGSAPQAPYGTPQYGTAPQSPYGAMPAPSIAPPPAAPPGAYQVPVGGYTAPIGAYAPPAAPVTQAPFLGILSLIFALVAAVVTPLVVGFASFEIGRRIPEGISVVSEPDLLAILSPARDQVLWAEISFWVGTALGIAAIVIGIIAIRRRQGRGQGIAGIVIAAVAPAVFFVVLGIAISMGAATGTAELFSS